MSEATKRIVIIEPDLVWAKTFSERVLIKYNYASFLASGPNDGLLLALNNKPHLLILHLSPEDSLQFLRRLARAHTQLPTILVADDEVSEISINLLRLGVRDCIAHPFLFDDIIQSIGRILRAEAGPGCHDNRPQNNLPDEQAEILERRVKEFEMIFKIGRSINTQFDLEAMLNRVTEAAVYITGAEEGYLLLADENTGKLELRAAQNLGERSAQEFSLPISDSIAGAVVRSGKPAILGETKQNYKVKTGYLVKSLINVPLKVNDQIIGVLGVDNQISRARFSSTHLNRLNMLADIAAAMLEHARQYAGLHRKLKRRTQEVSAVQTLAEQLKTVVDFEAGARLILSIVLRTTKAEAGVLMWQAHPNHQPQYFALGSLGDQVLSQKKTFNSGQWWNVDALLEIAKTGRPILQNQPAEPSATRLSRMARSGLAVPISDREHHIVGVLSLESTVEQAFSAADLEFVVNFTDQIVLALDHLFLQHITRVAHKRFMALTNFIDEAVCVLDADLRLLNYNQAADDIFDMAAKDVVGYSVYELWPPANNIPHPFCLLIEQAIAEKRIISFGNDTFAPAEPGASQVAGGKIIPLFERNQAAGALCLFRPVQPDRSDLHLEFEFANMASHLFRTPLNLIQNSIDLLLHVTMTPDEQAPIFRKMRQQGQQLTDLTHELLKILRMEVEGIAVQRKSLQLGPLVENALALLQNQDPRYTFHVSVTDPMPRVCGDLPKIELVLVNLLLNAIKRSAGGGDIAIKTRVNKSEVIISVADKGEPVTSRMRRRMFERFYAVDDEGGKTPSTYQLGLFTTRRLVELQNGRIWIENLADGVSFNFSLPIEEKVNDNNSNY